MYHMFMHSQTLTCIAPRPFPQARACTLPYLFAINLVRWTLLCFYFYIQLICLSMLGSICNQSDGMDADAGAATTVPHMVIVVSLCGRLKLNLLNERVSGREFKRGWTGFQVENKGEHACGRQEEAEGGEEGGLRNCWSTIWDLLGMRA